MKTYLKLAWRNLWRNRRRTLITTASIFFGVLLSAYMSSMQEGSYDNMVANVVQFYSGHIQVHQKDYWEEQTINHTFVYSDSLRKEVQSTKHVTTTSPRLESFALASHKEKSKGVMILGIEPHSEDRITQMSEKISKGNYLRPGDNGVIVAKEAAKYLNLDVNDSLVIVSQGYHGVSAFGKYPVKGIIDHPSPEFNRRLVLMDINNCQNLFSAYNRLSALVVMVDDNKYIGQVYDELQSKLDDHYKPMTWEQMQPMLVQQIEADRASGVIMKAILYVIIGFGILGTIMMMMAERRREMGVMIAVGMQKFKLSIIMIFETLFIGFLGVISGIVMSIPLNWYFYLNPIRFSGQAAQMMIDMGFEPVMVFSMAPKVFYDQAITVFIFTIIIGIYPLIRINRMKVINALRA